MQSRGVLKAKQNIGKKVSQGKITKQNGKDILGFIERLEIDGKPDGDPYSQNRIRKYLYCLGSICQLTEKDILELTEKDVKLIVSKIRDKYSPETKRDYTVMLRIFIKYVYEEAGNEYDEGQFPKVVKKIKPGKRHRAVVKATKVLTLGDIEKMVQMTTNPRDRCFLIMLYESGCRISELIGSDQYPGVRIKDIQFTEHGVMVDVKGKTGERSLDLYPSAPAISNWLNQHPRRDDPEAPLFCSIWGKKKGQRVNYQYFNNLLKGKADNRKRKGDKKERMPGLAEKAGINKPSHPHWFRHSRATELAKFMTEAQLCYYMGWEQGSQQVRTYIHAGKDTVAAALKEHYGFKDKEKPKTMKPIVCPRCKTENDPFAKFCNGCSLGLSKESMLEYETQKEEAERKAELLQENLLERLEELERKLKSK